MTVRQRLYDLGETVWWLCRDEHERTYSVIAFLQHVIVDDEVLNAFMTTCYEDTNDPRSNPFFNPEKWPDLTIKTHDDENQHVIDKLQTYENDFPIIMCYRDLLNER